ncbi:glycopeptide antibiotics resistance protein [Nocardioides daedukensis]|uniref:Glycopeptide antibiotics resistance protein n=1 Tax=Nocardioides daedukensis TaxID=634462 RepID=A0A7Y9RZD7_9ACTN|nr:VanZ family protein [Nocardioides daedukensis]NYG59452.1 glycopeptide antibiotics resistance protein [Nocardioides daedukensis]
MRRSCLAAYAVYLAAAAYLVFWPQPDTPAGAVFDVLTLLQRVGITFVPGLAVEFVLNVALFVPLTLLGVLIWPRINPLQWVLTGVAATVLIEFIQYAALPDRSATLIDVVANALGALIGVDLALRLRWLIRKRAAGTSGNPAATTRPGR